MAKRLPDLNIDSLKGSFREQFDTLVKNAGGSTPAKVGAIGAVVGAGFDAVSASKDQRGYLSDLVEEYRPEIAERFGLAANQVTQEHFEAVYDENPVLAQVKDLSKIEKRTRVVSGVLGAGSGLLAGLGAAGLTRRAQSSDNQTKNSANIASGIISTVGAMMSGRLIRKFMHRKGDWTLADSAHGHIMAIRDKQLIGEQTTPADIFKMQLAINPEIDEMISQAYGKPFGQLEPQLQDQVLRTEVPDVLALNTELSRRINDGARPQGLLFGMVEDVKPKELNTTPEASQVRPEMVDAIAQQGSNQAVGQETPAELVNASKQGLSDDDLEAEIAAMLGGGANGVDAAKEASATSPDAPMSEKEQKARGEELGEFHGPLAPDTDISALPKPDGLVHGPDEDPEFARELEQMFAQLDKGVTESAHEALEGQGLDNNLEEARSYVEKLEQERDNPAAAHTR